MDPIRSSYKPGGHPTHLGLLRVDQDVCNEIYSTGIIFK